MNMYGGNVNFAILQNFGRYNSPIWKRITFITYFWNRNERVFQMVHNIRDILFTKDKKNNTVCEAVNFPTTRISEGHNSIISKPNNTCYTFLESS